jgi:hypothetical protein
MKFLCLLVLIILTSCNNLELVGNVETVYSTGVERSVNKTKIKYKTEYKETPIIFSTTAINDLDNINKPINVASSVEVWFW